MLLARLLKATKTSTYIGIIIKRSSFSKANSEFAFFTTINKLLLTHIQTGEIYIKLVDSTIKAVISMLESIVFTKKTCPKEASGLHNSDGVINKAMVTKSASSISRGGLELLFDQEIMARNSFAIKSR